jgi:hypothetical protein
MQMVRFFLAFLFVSSAVSAIVAQVTAQSRSSVASETDSVVNQKQVNLRESSSAKNEKGESGSGAEHNLHLRLGAIALGAGYSHFSGPTYYSPYPYGFYPLGWEYSAWWFPYWGPYSDFTSGYFAYGSAKGEVKLAAEPKTAQVYLDRAYAGTANHLRNIWLEPGAYDLSLRAPGREDYCQRIYVLSGKALKITAKLAAAELMPGEAPGKLKDTP